MCAANIIIVEKSEKALKHAMELGGEEGIIIDGNEVERVMELTGGNGAEAAGLAGQQYWNRDYQYFPVSAPP